MTFLWLIIAAMALISAAVVLLPLYRGRAATGESREDYDVAIYKDQLKEAANEHERGLLNDAQLSAVTTEIQRKLLAAAEHSQPTGKAVTAKTAANRGLGLVIALFLIFGSFGIYSELGTPGLDNVAYADRNIKQEQSQANDDQRAIDEMQTLVKRLEERLVNEPDNIDGWLMLGRSANALGDYVRAATAFESALKLDPANPGILVDYAEAITFAQKGRVPSDAQAALEKARKLNPAHPKARYYIALAKAQGGKLEEALQEWVDLLAISLPDAPWRPTVEQQAAAAAQEAEIDLATIKPSAEALQMGADIRKSANAAKETSDAPGPNREQMEAAGQMSPEEREEMIRSMVQRLADRLQENPNDREGWLRLARAYQVLGEATKAEDAMARAEALAQ